MTSRRFHEKVDLEASWFAKLCHFPEPRPRESAIKVIDVLTTRRVELMSAVLSMRELEVKSQLANNIDFFIEDYAQNTLPLMEELGSSDPGQHIIVMLEYQPANPMTKFELTATEIGRLQRAFCRFEIFRRTFAYCSENLYHKVQRCELYNGTKVDEQAEYLAQFPDYQIAEIDCIRDYLIRRLRGICNEVEDEIAKLYPKERFMFDVEGDTEYEQRISGIFLFTHDSKRE